MMQHSPPFHIILGVKTTCVKTVACKLSVLTHEDFLAYSHILSMRFSFRIEAPTEGRCSIHLSYRRM
ncbi:MAG: hypothetical protein WC723_00870 [Candidatus Omnitrophota bacterium]